MTDVILPSEVDIVEVVGEFIELKDMGDTHVGLCPFHGEKTPSFRVYHDTSTYYCWGCHVNGDSIDFLREHNKWSFGKSVKHIEDKTNVKLKFEKEFKTEEAKVLSREFNDEVRTEIGSLSHNTKNYRGIRKDIAAYFKVGHEYDTQTGEVSAQYYPCTDSETHKLCGYRVRKVPKDFSTQYGVVGRQADPFGWFRFKKSTGKYCLIVAGEIDQLSAYQMLHDYTVKKGQQEYGFIPVICSTTGEGSVNQFKDKYEWFMGFERIHVCMDPDQAGNEAVEKLLKILPRDKVFVMNLQDGIDTNDYLTRGKDKEWINLFFKAQKKTMTGITGSGNLLQEMREYVSMERITLPPFMHKLQKMLKGGIPLGQIFTLLAGSGAGKSTYVDSMVLHWIIGTGYKVGIVSLEASAGEYGVNLGSSFIKNKINLGETVQERLETIDSNEDKLLTLFNDEEGGHRFFLVDADIMDLQKKIENLVIAEGCKIIVLDPIQDIFDALPDDAQAKFMKWQKDLVKREKVTIVNVSHARKSQGGTKGASQGQSLSEEDCHGSSSIFKSSGIIVVITRNKEAEDEEERNTSVMKMTKARGIGDTGPVGSYYYESPTHQLHDIDDWHNRSGGGTTVEF